MNPITFPDLLDILGHNDHISLCTSYAGKFTSDVVQANEARNYQIPTDRDAWFSVNPLHPVTSGRGTVADVTRLAALYADLDIKDTGLKDFETASTVINTLSEILHTRPSAITLSGNGMQPYWPLEDEVTGVQAIALLRRFGRLVRHVADLHHGNVDSVYDLSRILRIPGSVNHKSKTEPKPVLTFGGEGRPLTYQEIDEALTAYNVRELPEDRQELGEIVKPTGEWAWANRTCRYTKNMIEGWAGDNPNARHPWLVSQATRLAAARRLGCITTADHAAAVQTLGQRFLQLISTGAEKRAESIRERPDAFAWGEQKIACKTEPQARDELGNHTHDDAVIELMAASDARWTPTIVQGGKAPQVNGTSALAIQPEPQAAATTLERSEDGHAHQLIAAHGNTIRYCPERGLWLTWGGSRWGWEPSGGGMVREHAKAVARGFRVGDQAAVAHKRRSLSSNGVSGCLKTAQTDARIVVSVQQFDADPYALNTPSGAVDLRTGILHLANPDAMHTRSTLVAPDPEQPITRWLAFLNDTFEGSPALLPFVQRLAGYSATGNVTHHVLPFLHGPGGNGKSVLLDVLRALLGDYAGAAPAKFLMAGQQQHETEIARLSGLRMVICSEVNQSDKFDEAKVKLLTGGDTLTARFMQQDHFDFQPTHHLWLMGNHQPKVSGGGESFWRRLRMLKFMNVVPDCKKIDDLASILIREEGAGILAWVIEGACEILAHGLQAPDEVMFATRAYAEEEDTLARFLSDRCRIGGGPHVTTATATLRGEYEKWCQQEGETPLSPQVFGRELRTRFEIEQSRSNGRRFYIGISVTVEDPATEWFK